MHFAGSRNDSLILGYYLAYKLCFYTLLPYIFTCTFYNLKIACFIPCFLPLFTSLFIPHLSNFIYTFLHRAGLF